MKNIQKLIDDSDFNYSTKKTNHVGHVVELCTLLEDFRKGTAPYNQVDINMGGFVVEVSLRESKKNQLGLRVDGEFIGYYPSAHMLLKELENFAKEA